MQDFIETNLVQPLAGVPYAATLVGLLVLALVAWIANWLTRRVLLVVVGRLAKASPTQWDDAIMGNRVLARLATVVPALIVLRGIRSEEHTSVLQSLMRNSSAVYCFQKNIIHRLI